MSPTCRSLGDDHPIDVSGMQGNILSPFPRQYQAFLLVRFHSANATRKWLRQSLSLLMNDVLDARCPAPRSPMQAPCVRMGIGLTFDGLQFLAPALTAVFSRSPAFVQGAAPRSVFLRDPPASHEAWGFGDEPTSSKVHAVLLVSSNAIEAIERFKVGTLRLLESHGISVLHVLQGSELSGELRGCEHFGFREGLSQPVTDRVGALRSVSEVSEFNCSYSRFWRDDKSPLLRDGCFQVFRRLDQDVRAWRAQLSELSRALPTEVGGSEGKIAELLVGRRKSGVSLAADALNGEIIRDGDSFDGDPFGIVTPRFAHVRKMLPRVSHVQDGDMHRLIRRSIPFGPAYDATEVPGGVERGILFNAYMASIERQFEFVVRAWANHADFPEADDGPDAVIGRSPHWVHFRTRSGKRCPVRLHSCVSTRGALYAFVPGVEALCFLSAE